MNEDKAARYHRLRRRIQVGSVALVVAALVTFVGGGGGVFLASVAEAAAAFISDGRWRWAASVVAAALLLALGLEILSFPGAYSLGYLLDRRYGLSRQTQREWWSDHAKAVVLGLVMASMAALVAYGSLAHSPAWWWLVAGSILSAFAALLAVAAPVVLLPWFYRLRKLPAGDLVTRLEALAVRAGTPVLGVYEWSLGDKSRVANAALVGMGPTRRILLSDTLLAEYSPDEIEVIIAHELAHHVHGDIWKVAIVEAAQLTLALLSAHLALVWLGPGIGLAGPHDLAGMPLMALAAGLSTLVAAPFLLRMSRRQERRADRHALELTGKADAFVSAMRRIGAQNLADEEPGRLVEWLFHSHPSLRQRIDAARRWAEGATGG